MVSSHKTLANVIGGKTARACDNCVRKRARWYCAADDAFLCQSCDGSVRSANPLARRHERVRLKTASLKLSSLDKPAAPQWHQGFTKKPRTPRGGKHASKHAAKSEESGVSLNFNPLHLVPEIGSDETTATCEEQLLYQVPVLDPFAAELCVSVKQTEVTTPVEVDDHHGSKVMVDMNNSLNGLMLPSDVELAEFAADVESLLGKGLDEESFAMEGLGLMDCRESLERVKVEEQDDNHHHMQSSCDNYEMEMMREPFQLSFDYDSPLWDEEKLDDKVMVVKHDDEDQHVHININVNIEKNGDDDDDENKKHIINKRILKLDYEGVMATWDEERSPWTTGHRPEVDPDQCWLQCMDGIMNHHNPYGDMGMMTGNPAMLDGGREARVSRYREKRRTRLFSKKIRYEVRKLNAEKRPRMKGRFVKRASSLGFPLLSK
ncbi:zinc finger protein CONSTANS-LIKE 6-like [Bidens hawaiensis]|uniref:zinc finger protein CONSTANS-LIKE 6-like n=1 Tax=Bidens hawaiensis TaxID=980011 RepID=UPI0040490AA3